MSNASPPDASIEDIRSIELPGRPRFRRSERASARAASSWSSSTRDLERGRAPGRSGLEQHPGQRACFRFDQAAEPLDQALDRLIDQLAAVVRA